VPNLLTRILPSPSLQIKLKRFGRRGDGGYYLALPIQQDDFLISAGLADDISFEEDISMILAKVLALDHTIPEITSQSKNFIHLRNGLKGEISPGFLTLEHLIEEYPAPDYLLKIDIEGDEWEVFAKTNPFTLSRFRQIVVEFHGFTQPKSPEAISQVRKTLDKLLENHYVVAVHANNHAPFRYFGSHMVPDVIEVTYLRKDASREIGDELNDDLLKKQEENTHLLRPIGFDWVDSIRGLTKSI